MPEAHEWIESLKLVPHPEGGFYRQSYRADLMLPQAALGQNFGGNRPASTAIYFLLQGTDFSAFHRLASDEAWHFYTGSTLVVHILTADGGRRELKLGPNPHRGEVFQAVVPAGLWFASCLLEPGTFALVGCTVAPGFDFADFEMAERDALLHSYPQHAALIRRLTRQNP